MQAHTFHVSVGDQVFLDDSLEEVGAVRRVERDHLVVYIENSGDFAIEGPAVKAAHGGKVVLDRAHLPDPVLAAVAKAHEQEIL